MAEASGRRRDPLQHYRHHRISFWNSYAHLAKRYERIRSYYHRRLLEIYRFNIPEGMAVIEIGCGYGDLLAGVKPSFGMGVDFSAAMLQEARKRHPHLEFVHADAHQFETNRTFDFIICSDLVNDLWNVQTVFERLRPLCHSGTRVILNAYSRLWEIPRKLAEVLGLAKPMLEQNWLTVDDISNLLYLSGFELIRRSPEIMWPLRTPAIDTFANRYLVKLWLFRQLAITNLFVARPAPQAFEGAEPVVSVVVPARNEAGNIPEIFDRMPEMGGGTELIFVEGNSTDNTWDVIQKEVEERKRPRTLALRQPGRGKGDAVRHGFGHAKGGVLMILDADLTVAPEDLPRFYEAWRSGKGEFVNGVRLVYPMEQDAMRFFNLVGNKFFSWAFSWLLSQSIKDTLCGTKVMSRQHYERIAANRSYFGEFDPFGDFDLIFGAAKQNLKFVDLPIRYGERVYGETNIHRWSHGLVLLRMTLYALWRIKFV